MHEMRAQVTPANKLQKGDQIVLFGSTPTFVQKIHPSQGRIPADGNRKVVIHTNLGVNRIRGDQPVRKLQDPF
jgi:preprotein translocase subunit YajC